MGVKGTVSKIAKGIGEINIGEKVKKANKFINDHVPILEEVQDKNKYDSLLYFAFPHRIKQKYAIGALVGVGAIKASDRLYNMENRHAIGKVEAGGLSHMTSQAVSPLTEKLQNGEYNPENIMYGKRIKNSGAEGDIVFALHNMR